MMTICIKQGKRVKSYVNYWVVMCLVVNTFVLSHHLNAEPDDDNDGVSDNAQVTISLDRGLYPLPFGVVEDFDDLNGKDPQNRSLFPYHTTALGAKITSTTSILNGDVILYIKVSANKYNEDSENIEQIAVSPTTLIDGDLGPINLQNRLANDDAGPISIYVKRDEEKILLATAGGPAPISGKITTLSNALPARELGPLTETAANSGVFLLKMAIRYTDGPANKNCPATTTWTNIDGIHYPNGTLKRDEENRFFVPVSDQTTFGAVSEHYCILKGDTIIVEYIDLLDKETTATFEANFKDTFDGSLKADKDTYIVGQIIILALIDPDLNLDSNKTERLSLDLIEWKSTASTLTIQDGKDFFKPEPAELVETGPNTGVFKTSLMMPSEINGIALGQNERIDLEYMDWAPSSGANYVGQAHHTTSTTIFTSNFGALIELDKVSYQPGDTIKITVTAPDHNIDETEEDDIGNTLDDPFTISTRSGSHLAHYTLHETGEDTGIFSGSIRLVADTDDDPIPGTIQAQVNDALTLTFDYGGDEPVEFTVPIGLLFARNAIITDSSETIVDKVSVNEQVQIKVDLLNTQDQDQTFAYIVQIKNDQGVVMDLMFSEDQVVLSQLTSRITLPWVPSHPGEYFVTIYIWESLANPGVLSPAISKRITVD